MTDSLSGAHMRQELTSQPQTWAQAAEMRDAQALLPASGARIAVVALTRSGTTTEVLELVDRIKGRIRTIGVIGDPDSPLVSLVDDAVLLPFADEQSVVQTRFATTALALFRASLGEDLSAAIADAAAVLTEPIDDELRDAEQYTFLGRGWTIGLAHAAALKMRESSQSWTE